MVQKTKNDKRLFKPRNPVKVSMDRIYHGRVFKSKIVSLREKAADQQIKDFFRGDR